MRILHTFSSRGKNYVTLHWLVLFSMAFISVSCNDSGIVEPEEMPEVLSTEPAEQAESVATNTSIVAHFNKKMDPSSFSSTTFTLMQGNTAVLGVVSASDSSATLNPFGRLEPDAVYTAIISSDVKDLSGNELAESYTWRFRTGEGQEDPVEEDDNNSPADNTPPVVQSTEPQDHATDVPIDASINATFSEEINPSSLNENSFTLRYGTTHISGAIEYNEDTDLTARFIPSEELPSGQTFTATISTDVEDSSGNSMEDPHQWSFTTQEITDEDPPEIVETHPEDNETDVDEDEVIRVTFDEEMDPSTINESTFTLEWGWWGRGREVSGTVEYENNTARFIPDEDMGENRIYTATISGEVQDAAGNPLGETHEWNFQIEDD